MNHGYEAEPSRCRISVPKHVSLVTSALWRLIFFLRQFPYVILILKFNTTATEFTARTDMENNLETRQNNANARSVVRGLCTWNESLLNTFVYFNKPKPHDTTSLIWMRNTMDTFWPFKPFVLGRNIFDYSGMNETYEQKITGFCPMITVSITALEQWADSSR